MKEIANKMGIKVKPERKLICSLSNRERYVVHYAELQSAIQKGFKVTKIHEAMEFDEQDWMRPFIEYNINKRKAAKTKFEKY